MYFDVSAPPDRPPSTAGALDRAGRERARAVRELHDLVTHAVSQIVVQAGVLEALACPHARVPGGPLALLARTARDAMGDLRRMGAVINDGLAVPYGPQPGMAELAALLDAHRAAGFPVEARLPGPPAEVGPSASLALFRVVEEVLALQRDRPERPGTLLLVDVEAGALRALLEVAPPGAPLRPGELAAARERVRVHGGTVEVMTLASGAWRLRARLPLEPAAG